ncbi:hypothetical protein U27_02824 [Candidatus Vecturithrix granuli]|uniref:4Fe-4S ferredoxin-type domain-containing protein n=1 Tax=Vecturithrix granuli TaxID=1499967 RepID=A0A081BU58_VECG1|nr:hypothetical protein U27_02824 [Candidatus Vecturithrix granuli]
MNLTNNMKDLAENLGADFFGVADLAPAHEAILLQGGATVAGFPRAIALGVRLFDPIVDLLPQRAERAVAVAYKHHCYHQINERLDQIASRLSSVLQRDGHKVFPIPASQRVDDEHLCAMFSHKLAAYLAGLGWIGKSCLLVTPEVGPRARWTTILTDAPLTVTGKPMEVQCGDCHQCVDICPTRAFTGKNFRACDPRDVRYDAAKCDRYFNQMRQKHDWAVCGLCLYVCPHGRKNDKD